jgi:dipeptidyl aminopeptidase/acylaminoacyl peptidase
MSGAFIGLSVLTLAAPLIGETVATMAPTFDSKDCRLVDNLGLPYEKVEFKTDDNFTLRGWFFPAHNPKAPAILYAPATAHDQRSGLSLVTPFNAAGYHVLLFSYRGHGDSEGNRFGFTYGANESRDVDAAVRYLTEQRGIKRIVAIGHSAGAVSILLSAARNPDISCVIAVSPFPSVDAVWQTNRPAFFLPGYHDFILQLTELRKGFSRQQVQPLNVVADISPRPLLLVHGMEDDRITIDQAHLIYQAARQPKDLWLVEGATHASMRSPGLDLLIGQVIAYLNTALLLQPVAFSN